MFAVIAFILFLLAGFDAHFGDVSSLNLIAFGLAALALHTLVPLSYDRFRR